MIQGGERDYRAVVEWGEVKGMGSDVSSSTEHMWGPEHLS